MKVLITGIDGYLGWALAVDLVQRGYEVAGVDNGLRRSMVKEVGGLSVVPVASLRRRCKGLGLADYTDSCDLTDYDNVHNTILEFQPDAIVFLGQQPSAPYSMIDAHHAAFTQKNNLVGNLNTLHAIQKLCPNAHFIKLGSMGEYGTPNSNIPEGVFPPESTWSVPSGGCQGDLSGLMFPRQAGSWYHQSKVHDSHNTEMACRIWGLRATDVMQGIVYGVQPEDTPDELRTRLDVDECFGTVVHRFCAQAVLNLPLSVYGSGQQQRGFLHLGDSLQCLRLAIDSPAQPGEYRTFNQYAQIYTINGIAEEVCRVADQLGINPSIKLVPNPRVEAEGHQYQPVNHRLRALGYQFQGSTQAEIKRVLQTILKHRNRLQQVAPAIAAQTQWVPTP